MRKLVNLLFAALLAFGGVAPATGAPIGNPFMRGLSSPSQLADLIKSSLSVDPTGQSQLDPVRCKKDGSCATPNDYLAMFALDDPDAHLAKSQDLPAYLRLLTIRDAPQGKYWMACLQRSHAPSGWTALHDCLARAAKAGEKFWFDPKTGRPVLAEDCTNPIGQPENPDQCAYIDLYTREGDTALRAGQGGPKEIDENDQCAPAIKRPGEQDFESLYVEECPDASCDMTAIEAATGIRIWKRGSIATKVPGLYIVRVPKFVTEKDSPYRFFFCIERWQGPSLMVPAYTGDYAADRAAYDAYLAEYHRYIATHSYGIGVQWFDYLRDSTKIATIYYDADDSAQHNARTTNGEPTVLWWHWPGQSF